MVAIIDGNAIAETIYEDLRLRTKVLKNRGMVPRLVVILVGDNPASLSYIKIKQKKALEIGIDVDVKRYPRNASQDRVLSDIKKINGEKQVCGILVQLPLPKNFDHRNILDAVDPKLDVDCLTTHNKERLVKGERPLFYPPAPSAVLKILDYHGMDLKNLNVLLIGSGDLVGKPLAAMLLKRGVDFELANRYTENLRELAGKADVIITGVGKAGLVTGEIVKEGAVVIDAGTTGSESGGIAGDVDFQSVSQKAGLIAPVPGGVGPVTVAMLIKNVVDSAFDRLVS